MEKGNAQLKSNSSRGKKPSKERKTSKSSKHAIQTQEDLWSLKVRVEELKHENHLLSRELNKHSADCMKISDENKMLMESLRKICDPEVIRTLEELNPENNAQSDDQSSSVITGISESSPDCADTAQH